MGRDISVCLSHKSDEWCTPSKIYKRFMDQGYYDPCPINHIVDGLSIDWKNWNFVNPPYSQIDKWVSKAIEEGNKGNWSIMLLPVRTDTKWFKKLVLNGCEFMFIEGRLKFNDTNSAPFPSMFVVVKNTQDFYRMSWLCKETMNRRFKLNE